MTRFFFGYEKILTFILLLEVLSFHTNHASVANVGKIKLALNSVNYC
jgi:hypothetical protein